jgi:hypothetical protein
VICPYQRLSHHFYPSVGSCNRNTERAWNGDLSLNQNPSDGAGRDSVLTDAYEHTLRKLNLVERSDPITQLIAKKIIEIHQRGERNPQKLSELTIKELGVRVTWSPSEKSDDPSWS